MTCPPSTLVLRRQISLISCIFLIHVLTSFVQGETLRYEFVIEEAAGFASGTIGAELELAVLPATHRQVVSIEFPELTPNLAPNSGLFGLASSFSPVFEETQGGSGFQDDGRGGLEPWQGEFTVFIDRDTDCGPIDPMLTCSLTVGASNRGDIDSISFGGWFSDPNGEVIILDDTAWGHWRLVPEPIGGPWTVFPQLALGAMLLRGQRRRRSKGRLNRSGESLGRVGFTCRAT